MRRERLIRPGHRKPTASTRPSHAEAQFPLRDYIVPPTDAQGRSSTISFSVPPSVQRLAKILVESHDLPFETSGDAYRWAVFHGVRALAEVVKNKEYTSEMNDLMNLITVKSTELESMFQIKHIRRLMDAVETLAREGHPARAWKLAELVWMRSDRKEDPYWRKYQRNAAKEKLDMLRVKYGYVPNGKENKED